MCLKSLLSSFFSFLLLLPLCTSDRQDWNTGGNKAKLQEVYQGFDPALLALLDLAEVGSLKVWELVDMDVLPSWTNERLALLGDAAHPFLPRELPGRTDAMWGDAR